MSSNYALVAALTTMSEKIAAAVPFIAAALLVAAGACLSGRIQGSANKALQSLFENIERAGGKVRGLPSATDEHFASVAAWMGDVGTAFTSMAGVVAASILLLREVGADSAAVYCALALVIALIVAFARLLLADPTTYPSQWRTRLSPFQLALLLSNLILAAVILSGA